MNLLITGVGGPAGICFAKSLSEIKELNLIGANAENDDMAKKFLQRFYILPFANNPDFINYINEIIKKERIDLLIPLVDEELSVVSENVEKINCRVLVSPKETIELTTNKKKTYEKLSKFLPKRFDKDFYSLPLLAKPAISRGGRDINIVHSQEDLEKFDSNKYVFQEILESPEYTVDALFDFFGTPLVIVPRIRSRVEGGISVTGKVVLNEEIISKVREISKILKFVGPVNFQFMNSKEGFKLMEINSRSSGGMGITINSGVDIPKLVYMMVNGLTIGDPKVIDGEFDNFEEILERQRLKMEGARC